MVKNGASSHEKTILTFSLEILNLERHKSLYWFKNYGNFNEWVDFFLLVELHRKGSALKPAQQACFITEAPNKLISGLPQNDRLTCHRSYPCQTWTGAKNSDIKATLINLSFM